MDGVVFGVAFAALAVALSRMLRPDVGRAFFALLLSAAAAVYVGGALGDRNGSAVLQGAAFAAYLGIALWGWRRPLVLGLGWFGHSLWDALHLAGPLTSVVPGWYELGCIAVHAREET